MEQKKLDRLQSQQADWHLAGRKNSEKREAKIREEAERARRKAESFKDDPEATSGLLADAAAKIDSDGKGPLKDVLDDLLALIRMVKAYIAGEYREVPWNTVALAIGAIAYFVQPIDLVPDPIPVAGYADDAAVIAFVVSKIKADLDAFKEWERTR